MFVEYAEQHGHHDSSEESDEEDSHEIMDDFNTLGKRVLCSYAYMVI